MSLMRMSLSGAVIILVVTVIRAVALHKLPKRVLLAFWGIAVARLLLPVSLPPVLGRLLPADGRVGVVDTAGTYAASLRAEAAPALPVLRLVWAVGAALCLAAFALGHLRCRREFRTSLPVRNELVREWLSAHPLRRSIDVRSLTGLSTPLTYGVLHPVILMPKATDWANERQVRYVLFHEYVHICRFDTVRKWIVAAAVCVHWFNPMAWVLYVLYDRDIELTCDEGVLRRFGGGDRASYARALIGMEETRRQFTPFYNYFAKNALEERIEAIMKFSKKSISVLALALVLVTLVAGTAFAADQPRETPDPTDGTAQEDVETGYIMGRFEDENGQTVIVIDSRDPSCRKVEMDTEILFEMGTCTLHAQKNVPSELLD